MTSYTPAHLYVFRWKKFHLLTVCLIFYSLADGNTNFEVVELQAMSGQKANILAQC